MATVPSPPADAAATGGGGPGIADFRVEYRSWLTEHLPIAWRDLSRGSPEGVLVPARRGWGRALSAGGWLGVTWPVRYGGRGLTAEHQLALVEESVRIGAPEPLNSNGIGILGPLLLRRGTPEQRERYLRPLLAHDTVWCQGFSEPGAGSDLAALQTRAVRDGDGFRITGQKVWTTYAHEADRCYLLARTGGWEGPKHKGITMFLLDMHQPQVTVRPLRNLLGAMEFNEVFLDDAWVAEEDVVGEPGQGWALATEALSYERGISFAERALKLRREFALVAEMAQRHGTNRDLLVDAYADTLATGSLVDELVRRSESGADLGALAPIAKVFWSETHQRLLALATRIATSPGTTGPGDEQYFWNARLSARAESIYGGTSEIQRNLIARSLGLPSGRPS